MPDNIRRKIEEKKCSMVYSLVSDVNEGVNYIDTQMNSLTTNLPTIGSSKAISNTFSGDTPAQKDNYISTLGAMMM